jgi:hypothetical protein
MPYRWRPVIKTVAICGAILLANGSTFAVRAIAADPPVIEVTVDVADNTQASIKPAPSGCDAAANSFENAVWAKVGETICLRCHTETGEAAESEFRLTKPRSVTDAQAISRNGEAFWKMALRTEQGESWLLAKASGRIKHGGGEAVVAGSNAWQVLESFVRRAQVAGSLHSDFPSDLTSDVSSDNSAKLFDGVRMISDTQLLRRVTLSLAGRLPTIDERARVVQGGAAAFDEVLDEPLRDEDLITAWHQLRSRHLSDVELRHAHVVAEKLRQFILIKPSRLQQCFIVGQQALQLCGQDILIPFGKLTRSVISNRVGDRIAAGQFGADAIDRIPAHRHGRLQRSIAFAYHV